MEFNLKTRNDYIVIGEIELNNIIKDILKFKKELKNKYNMDLEANFKFSK